MNTYRNAEVLELLKRGFSFTEVAGMKGMTRNAVAGIAWRHRTPWKVQREKRRAQHARKLLQPAAIQAAV